MGTKSESDTAGSCLCAEAHDWTVIETIANCKIVLFMLE